MSYQPKHFGIYELMPPELVDSVAEKTLWMLLDERILIAADALRDRYGPMHVNDWKWGGSIRYRGFRPRDYTKCSQFSQHFFGRALDMIPQDISAEEIRQDLRDNFQVGLNLYDGINYIRRIENNVSWLHIDNANTGLDYIYFFNP